nr:hypothetical protein [Desulfuromonadales bacterium]
MSRSQPAFSCQRQPFCYDSVNESMTPYQFHLLVAVLVSLWVHVAFFGAYHAQHLMRQVLRSVGLVKPAVTAAAETLAEPVTPTLRFVPVIEPARRPATPQVFIQTDERQATTEAPGA